MASQRKNQHRVVDGDKGRSDMSLSGQDAIDILFIHDAITIGVDAGPLPDKAGSAANRFSGPGMGGAEVATAEDFAEEELGEAHRSAPGHEAGTTGAGTGKHRPFPLGRWSQQRHQGAGSGEVHDHGSTAPRSLPGIEPLIQLRAGSALIDIVPVEGGLGRAGGAPPGEEGRNMDHFCLRLERFDD